MEPLGVPQKIDIAGERRQGSNPTFSRLRLSWCTRDLLHQGAACVLNTLRTWAQLPAVTRGDGRRCRPFAQRQLHYKIHKPTLSRCRPFARMGFSVDSVGKLPRGASEAGRDHLSGQAPRLPQGASEQSTGALHSSCCPRGQAAGSSALLVPARVPDFPQGTQQGSGGAGVQPGRIQVLM